MVNHRASAGAFPPYQYESGRGSSLGFVRSRPTSWTVSSLFRRGWGRVKEIDEIGRGGVFLHGVAFIQHASRNLKLSLQFGSAPITISRNARARGGESERETKVSGWVCVCVRVCVCARAGNHWKSRVVVAVCCDATLVSPLTRTGHPHPCTVEVDGAALKVAERRKHSTYPELARGGPQKLLVLGSEIGGGWNATAQHFVRNLVRLRALRAPPAVRRAASSGWARRWWGALSVAVQLARRCKHSLGALGASRPSAGRRPSAGSCARPRR